MHIELSPAGNVGPATMTAMQHVLADPTALVDATIMLAGNIPPGVVWQAAREVCRRHEALRTTIDPVASTQTVHAYSPGVLATIQLNAAEGRLIETINHAAQHEIDPERLPVFRCILVSDGERRSVVHLAAPHAVTDLSSLHIVARDFLALVREQVTGQPAQLPPLQAQHVDYLRWREQLCGRESTWEATGPGGRALSFWSSKLAGAVTPAFGHVRSGPTRLERMSFLYHTVDAELAAQMARVAEKTRSSPFHVVLAAFEEAVALQTGTHDVTTLCMVHGRGRAELRDTVGPLTEEVAFRHHVGAESRRAYLRRLAADALMTYVHQDIPLTAVAERSPEVKRLYAQRRFRSMYLQYRPVAIGAGLTGDIPGVEVSFPRSAGSMPMFRLPGGALFSVDSVADRLEVELMYDPRVWPDEAMHQLVAGFASSCRSFAWRADEPLSVK